MELHLRLRISALAADWAGKPGKAAALKAGRASGPSHMAAAGIRVISPNCEGSDRTGCQAGFSSTGVARPRLRGRHWQVKASSERQGSAIGVPESVFRVDEDTDGRGLHGFRRLRPTLKRQIGRTTKGKKGIGPQPFANAAQDAPRPAIESVRATVFLLRRVREGGPDRAIDISDKDQGGARAPIAQWRHAVNCRGVKPAARHKTEGRASPPDLVEVDGAH